MVHVAQAGPELTVCHTVPELDAPSQAFLVLELKVYATRPA